MDLESVCQGDNDYLEFAFSFWIVFSVEPHKYLNHTLPMISPGGRFSAVYTASMHLFVFGSLEN